MRYVIGSISSGTLRDADLLESFGSTLESLARDTLAEARGASAGQFADALRVAAKHLALCGEAEAYGRMLAEDDIPADLAEYATETVQELADALQEYAAPYFYFGSHAGDGADFGFWLAEDVAEQVRDSGGLVVDDTAEVPADYRGEVLQVSDHGNLTLYAAEDGGLREIWGIV